MSREIDYVVGISASDDVQNGFVGQVLGFVVYFNIIAVVIKRMLLVDVNRSWEGISGVASVIFRQHQNYLQR